MTTRGACQRRRVPTRTCVGCRTSRAKRELVRVVRTPDGRAVFDPTGKVAGRGAYLCADGSCWRTAVTRNAVSRALGVPLPEDVAARLAAGPTIESITMNPTTTQGGARGQE